MKFGCSKILFFPYFRRKNSWNNKNNFNFGLPDFTIFFGQKLNRRKNSWNLFLSGRFCDIFQVHSRKCDFSVLIILVGDNHGVKRVAVERVDVVTTVSQLTRSWPAKRAIVAVWILDLWRWALSKNGAKFDFRSGFIENRLPCIKISVSRSDFKTYSDISASSKTGYHENLLIPLGSSREVNSWKKSLGFFKAF